VHNEKPKGVVLVSGGMDSCVTAAMARQTHDVAFLHAGYGQRTEKRERRCFQQIADYWAVAERLVVRLDYLKVIGGSALTDPDIAVPTGVAAGPDAVPVTYVPFRNTHLLSVAVSWAEVIGATAVFIGAVSDDSAGYPDCRPEFYHAFTELVRQGTRPSTRMDVCTPVIGMSKAEIVRRGIALGAPLHLTWSCYQDDEVACGVCDSCLRRFRAFQQAGQADPIANQVQ
jgi:7-cyano-7-deazaguanine synthase